MVASQPVLKGCLQLEIVDVVSPWWYGQFQRDDTLQHKLTVSSQMKI